MTIIHITNQHTWKEALEIGEYQADTLESEGFIHCCLPEQVQGVLEKWFQGAKDLLLLEIDPDRIKSRIKYENLEGGTELFPHIYGPINLDAVLSTKIIQEKTMRQDTSIERFTLPIHKTWDKTWFLLTSGDFQKDHFNCMTISWGGLGNMWNFPLAMVVVRPSRYTFEFINQYDEFTICAFPEAYRPALTILGTKSGRDCDKLTESGLTAEPSVKVAAPVYKEADLAIECRKLYWQDFNPEQFLDAGIHKNYESGDIHRMFYGEVLAVTADPEKYPNL